MNLKQKVPPLILAVIFTVLMFLTARIAIELNVEFRFKFEAFVLLTLIGLAVAIAGVVSFRRHETTVNPLDTENVSSLVTSGIFRYSRNPMYVGMLMGLAGYCLFTGNPLNIIFLVLFVWYMNKFQILPEEKILTKVFGDGYIGYQKRVRRWL